MSKNKKTQHPKNKIDTAKQQQQQKTPPTSSRINIFQRKLMQSTQKNERNPKIISKITKNTKKKTQIPKNKIKTVKKYKNIIIKI